MKRNSPPALRARLSKWISFQVFLSFAAVSLVVFVVINNHLSTRQSEGLEERRIHVEHMFEETSVENAVAELRHKLDDFLATHHELQLEIVDRNGNIFYEGDNLFKRVDGGENTKLTFATPPISDAIPAGFASIYFDNHADRELLRWLAIALSLSSILAAIAVACGARWLVKREMESVNTLVQQLHQISASTLGSRLDGTQQPQELQPIVSQFNELLDRLYSSYGQLENFNADVAHELNTPLTTLITSCELELRNANPNSNLYEILGSNLEELHRMSEIIKSMLFLSRAEQGSKPRCEKVDSVKEIVTDVIEYHEAMLGEAQVKITVKGDSNGEFDVPLLKRAISNLLGNAVRYAQTSSSITVVVSELQEIFVDITVMNVGVPIEKKALARLFDRFYRAEASRSMADKHHGLGLSIVAAIAHMHGGKPHAVSDNNETHIGFTMLKRAHNSVVGPESSHNVESDYISNI